MTCLPVEDLTPIDNEQLPERKTNVANDPLKRFRKGRPITNAEMEERVNAAYMLMLTGGTRRENCAQLAAKYGVSFRQAENYYPMPSS